MDPREPNDRLDPENTDPNNVPAATNRTNVPDEQNENPPQPSVNGYIRSLYMSDTRPTTTQLANVYCPESRPDVNPLFYALDRTQMTQDFRVDEPPLNQAAVSCFS